MTAYEHAARAQLSRLADSSSDVDTLRREAIEVLRGAIGFERWCSLLLDPETLVIAQGIGEIDWAAELPRLNLISASLSDVNNHTMLARSRDHVGVLSSATGGDLARSERWRDILSPYGVGDELRCVVADGYGSWGDFMLFRASDDRPFDADDAQLMRHVSDVLAGALRRHAIKSIENPEPTPAETGVVLLDSRLQLVGTTAPARAWFTALNPAETWFPDGIPALVWSVVGRLLAAEQGHDAGRPVRVRVRAADGRWAIVEAARLDGSDPGIAVTLRSAAADDVLALLSRAAGLSPRERELVALLLEGLATRELAERLFISRHTVQDHLKSVFEKVGVRSRRELLTGVFSQAA